MKKTKKRILVPFSVAMVIVLATFLLAGCEPLEHTQEPSSSNSDYGYEIESHSSDDSVSKDDRKILYQIWAEQSVNSYLSNVQFPGNLDEWSFRENYDGSTSVSTQVTVGDSTEKQLMTVILTLDEKGLTNTTHYVSVGGTVYLDEIPE